MTFRTRLVLAFGLAVLVPLGVLAFGVRREMTTRLDEQADRRVSALVGVLRSDLDATTRGTGARLRTLADELAADNRFRLAVLANDEGQRRWLLDWAGEAMRLGGLTLLQVRDSAGRILSSGHFRNEYDRLDPELPAAMARTNGAALVRARTADGSLLALASWDSFRVGGRPFSIVGGRAADSTELVRLTRDAEIGVALALPADSARPAAGSVVAELAMPYVDAVQGGRVDTARFVVTRDPGPLRELRRGVDRWFVAAVGVTLLLALAIAAWLAARLSRPLAELAAKTAQVDLDRLDQEFATDREDEVGALAQLLDTMTGRLRTSAARLREAERRATTGDLARQINHDVKNGLVPIRHVLRHLTQVAQQEPAQLAAIYQERRGTLESSVEYLENLARNYARLSPSLDHAAADLNAAVREVARSMSTELATVETRLAESAPTVRADPVVLRRILENLVGNAVDALDGKPGRVTLTTETVADGPEPRVRFTVADTGRGMTRDELHRAFDDFYTTKDTGTGLGLSVVRRLVSDVGGALRVQTTPGAGSRFTVELPG